MTRWGWIAGFSLVLLATVVALLLPADQVLRLKVWVAQQWSWALDLSRMDAAPGTDKWVHGAMFAALGVLGARAWRHPRSQWRLLLALLALGGLTEWAQHFVPGRSMSLADWLADAAGAALGLGLTRWLSRPQHPSARRHA